MAFSRRPRRCSIKTCRKQFMPLNMNHKLCGNVECAIEFARLAREKKEAQERRLEARRAAEEKRSHREKVERLKTRQQWLKEAQAVFNAYIRERDAKEACISCGSVNREAWDAGHLRSVGAAPHLRFNEDNVHKQCVPCNQFRSGNVLEYRRGLVQRIGEERVRLLESSNSPAHYSIEDAKMIKETYRAKLKELKAKDIQEAV
jgi:hypothetical protein